MKLKSIYGLALAALAAGAAVTACTDANDWDTNPAFDRMFGVNSNKISIETDQEDPSTVNVTFNPIQGAEYYIIEVSTDSLTDEVEMGGEHATVYGEDKSLTKSPATLVNMREETSYYMRMKTMSSTTPESKWVYYNLGAPFKTLGIIYDVPSADILENSVTLRWITKTGTVTHITYTTSENGQDVTETRTLTDAEIAAGVCTITGLKENKTYKFAIYNGEVLRGTKTVKTAKAMPWATVRQELGDDVTQIDQELMGMLAQKALDIMAAEGKDTASVTIGVPAGKTLTLGTTEESLNVPEGISVTFFGLAGEVPTLEMYTPLKADNHRGGYIRFEHINIDAMYDADAGTNGCQYVFQAKAECELDSMVFVECNISNIRRSLISMESSSSEAIHLIKIDNSIITNHAGDYAFIKIDKGGCTVDDIQITNSTFNHISYSKDKSIMDLNGIPGSLNVSIENCTFYNILGKGAFLISDKAQEKAEQSTINVSLYKVLFAKNAVEGAKGYRGVNMSATNSYMTSDFKLDKDYDWSVQSYNGSSTDIFENPATGDFTLKVTDLVRDEVGDPRWYTTQ